MAVPSTPTGLTQVADVVNTEYISRIIESAATDPLIGERIVMVTPLSPVEANSYTYQIPTSNEMTGAAVVTFPNAAPEDAWEPTSDIITGARVALSSFVGDAANAVGVVRAANEATKGLVHAVRDKIHQDTLGLFVNADNFAGNATTEFDLAFWAAQTDLFRAQNHDPGELHAAMHNHQASELRGDLMTSAASLFAASWGDRAANALGTSMVGGGVMFDGWMLHFSDDVPDGDTTGHTAGLLVRNDGGMSALELVVWQSLLPEMARGSDGAVRFGTWIVISTIVGVGIRAQKNLRALITRPAA